MDVGMLKLKNIEFRTKKVQIYLYLCQCIILLLIFKSNDILNFDGVTGDILILSPRFKNGNLENVTNKAVDVNGGLF